MPTYPVFPNFKPIELNDKEFISHKLALYQPETSELTFTNLYIWQEHYSPHWAMLNEYLFIYCGGAKDVCYALPPLGPPPRNEVTQTLLRWLQDELGVDDPSIERADHRITLELVGDRRFNTEPTREQFDYIYETGDMIHLSGRSYHSKKNFLNTFQKNYKYIYTPLRSNHIQACLDLEEYWCRIHRCEEDMGLMGEQAAIRRALSEFAALELTGGVIVIEGKVEAFSLGEMLNKDTAVVHVEKANPDIRGLYAVINQQFCEQAWANATYINREQDLGDEGLRKAKLSYNPIKFSEKFRIKLN